MATEVQDPAAGEAVPLPPPRWVAPMAGAVAAGVAFGVAELVAGALPGAGSPVRLVGGRMIDAAPPAVKDAAIAVLGTADKPALVIGIVLVGLAAGALLGRVARRRLGVAAGGFAGFAALGVAAAVPDPLASASVTLAATAAGAGAGTGALIVLLARGHARAAHAGAGGLSTAPRRPDDPPAFDRRAFVRLSSALGGGAAVAAAGGWRLGERARATEVRAATVLPPAARPVPAPAAGAALDVPGLSPLFTPVDDFFRIDTALSVPRVDPATWRLEVTGMVARPFSLGYEELLDLPMVEADVTLTCVSNEVGGPLVGTARWLGVPLADLLARAGASPAATQVVGRSVDGWTAGFPTAVARDGRAALVAVGMGGEPLPMRHGYPARLVVPGLYGYVSATKWLAELELTTWEAFDAYWVPRGWAKEGPVKTQSRIDVPGRGDDLRAGPVVIAGVAWAPHRGIAAVQVRVDGGPWRAADLGVSLGDDAWRQWRLGWDAVPGRHRLEVRAVDGAGAVQVEERSPPAPDGATGWHAVEVAVGEAGAPR